MSQSLVITPPPVDIAKSMGSVLRASAQESEALGTLAPDAVVALKDSGLLGLLVAPEFGGQGADVLTFIDVTEELSYHDTSAGWCYMVPAQTAAAFSGSIGDAAGKVFFGGDEQFLPAGQLAPMGSAKVVDGGYIVTGNYQFGSGINHANYVVGGAWLEKPSGEKSSIVYAVPKENAELRGNWNVFGLRGTGSFDYHVRETFVTEDSTFERIGAPIVRGQASLQFGAFLLGTAGHVSVALGSAKRALEEMAAIEGSIPSKGKDRFLYDFGEIEGRYKNARGAFVNITREYQEIAERGGTYGQKEFNRYRQTGVLVVQECLDVVTKCFLRAGQHAYRNPQPLGKYMRDMLVECQHALINMRLLSELGEVAIDDYRSEKE